MIIEKMRIQTIRRTILHIDENGMLYERHRISARSDLTVRLTHPRYLNVDNVSKLLFSVFEKIYIIKRDGLIYSATYNYQMSGTNSWDTVQFDFVRNNEIIGAIYKNWYNGKFIETTDRKIWINGDNFDGMLGRGNQPRLESYVHNTHIPLGVVGDLWASETNTIIRDSRDGFLYLAGCYYVQDTQNNMEESQLRLFTQMNLRNAVKVEVMERYIIALGTDGTIYIYGDIPSAGFKNRSYTATSFCELVKFMDTSYNIVNIWSHKDTVYFLTSDNLFYRLVVNDMPNEFNNILSNIYGDFLPTDIQLIPNIDFANIHQMNKFGKYIDNNGYMFKFILNENEDETLNVIITPLDVRVDITGIPSREYRDQVAATLSGPTILYVPPRSELTDEYISELTTLGVVPLDLPPDPILISSPQSLRESVRPIYTTNLRQAYKNVSNNIPLPGDRAAQILASHRSGISVPEFLLEMARNNNTYIDLADDPNYYRFISTGDTSITITEHPSRITSETLLEPQLQPVPLREPKIYTVTIYNSELIDTITKLQSVKLKKNDNIIFNYNGQEGVDAGGVSRQVFTKICGELTDNFFTRTDDHYFVVNTHILFKNYSYTIGQILAYFLFKNYSTRIRLSNLILSLLLDKEYDILEISATSEFPNLFIKIHNANINMLSSSSTEHILNTYINQIPRKLHRLFIKDTDGDQSFYDIVQEIISTTSTTSKTQIYEEKKTHLNTLFDHRKFVETYLLCKYQYYDQDGNINENLVNFVNGFTSVLSRNKLTKINNTNIEQSLNAERAKNPTWLPEYFEEYSDQLNNANIGLSDFITGSLLTTEFVLSKTILTGSFNDTINDYINRYVSSLSPNRLEELIYLWTGLRNINSSTKLAIFIKPTKPTDINIDQRLPVAHTCFYELEIPNYSNYKALERAMDFFLESGDQMLLAGGGNKKIPNKYVRQIKARKNVRKNSIKLELFILRRIFGNTPK